jgi:hypothetical protein
MQTFKDSSELLYNYLNFYRIIRTVPEFMQSFFEIIQNFLEIMLTYVELCILFRILQKFISTYTNFSNRIRILIAVAPASLLVILIVQKNI